METRTLDPKDTERQFHIVAIHDDQDHCDCCGKQNLKRVVLVVNAAGDEMNVGTECAAKLCGTTARKVKDDLQALAPGSRRRDRIASAWYHQVSQALHYTKNTDREVMAIRDQHSSFREPSHMLLASYVAQYLARS
jgi:hypothetical protein